MALKNFKTRNGVDIDTYTTPVSVVQATIKTNSITTVDTISMASFVSAEYLITITQGSKTRTSSVIMQTDGSSVDMTESGILETGGTIAGVVVSATTSSTNAVLQITITDAATTIARVKLSKNLNVAYTPTAPDAPTIGTATGGAETASITFTAPYDNGGATITSYRATSTPGSITGTASSSPVTVSGLTGGTAYTFIVAAINSAGVSAASSASNSVTPTVAPVQAAYFGGGSVSGAYNAVVDKMIFQSETTSTVSPGLATARYNHTGFANSGTAGYFAGGLISGPTVTNTVEKFAFSNDSRSLVSGGLSGARQDNAGFANSGTAGYAGGGRSNNSSSYVNDINKFAFSDDSRSTLAATLSNFNNLMYGFANSGTAGYFINAGTIGTSEKIAFSNDSKTTFSTGLTVTASNFATLSNSGTAAYISGNVSTTLYKILFSNDSFSTIPDGVTLQKSAPGAASKVGTAGYFAGGFFSGSTRTTIEKIIFPNDTKASVSSTISQGRNFLVGIANSGTL